MSFWGMAGPALSLMLAWAAGAAWVRSLLAGAGPGRWALVAGLGYPVGVAMAVASLVVMDAVSIELTSTAIWIALAAWLVAGVAIGLVWNARPAPPVDVPADRDFGGSWTRWLTILLGGLLGLRLLSILPDVLIRPVFPWDAWKTWAYKARVWFEQGELVPFAYPSRWAQEAADRFVIVGVDHPDFVSLIMLWQALGLDSWDDSMLALPWLVAGIACCLMIYGVLRRCEVPVWGALLAVYALVSLPIFLTHVALAGYADLWMALYMLAFAVAGWLWFREGGAGLPVLMALAVVCLAVIKDTGPYWLVAVLPAVVAGFLSRRLLVAVGLVAVVVTAVLMIANLDPIAWVSGGRYRLDWQEAGPVLAGLARHLFVWADWHLLWFAAPVIGWLGFVAAGERPEFRFLLTLVVLGLGVLIMVFLASRAGGYALIGTLFSRMLLHLAPAVVLLGALAIWTRLQEALQKAGTTAVKPGRA